MQVRLQTKLDEELIPNGSAAQGRTNKREWGKVSPFAEKIIRDTASMQEFHTSVVLLRGTIEKQTSSRQKYFDYLEERSFKKSRFVDRKILGDKIFRGGDSLLRTLRRAIPMEETYTVGPTKDREESEIRANTITGINYR